MPLNKSSLKRYRILDRCFRRSTGYQIQELLVACNKELQCDDKSVSRRTIYYDIEYMKSPEGWNAPIETFKDGNRHYYRYSDQKFSIENAPLSETQLKELQAAIGVINCFEGLQPFEGLQESIAKLELAASSSHSKPCFSLEHNDFVGGLSHLTPLFNAIQYESALKIKYQPFGESPADYIFHPQYLKQYNNRWYVLGVEEHHREQIWNLALDRIRSIKPVKKYSYVKLDVDWGAYFEDIIGVTNKEEDRVEKVHFQVFGKTAHYIYTKPFHGSQHHKWLDENTLDVTLSVKVNYELKRLLLSYAPNITILAPSSLLEDHARSLREALSHYSHDGHSNSVAK